MGQSAPTVGECFDAFEARYRGFRAALGREDQARFDEIVCMGRRHTPAINRYPHLDFERPMMLAVIVDLMCQSEAADIELLAEIQDARQHLADIGLLARRPVADAPGQTRLPVETATRDAGQAAALP